MPYKLTAEKQTEGQKTALMTYYRTCECGGEMRIVRRQNYDNACLVRCRTCQVKKKIRMPQERRVCLTCQHPVSGHKKCHNPDCPASRRGDT